MATAVPQPIAGCRGMRVPESPAGLPVSGASVFGLGRGSAFPSRLAMITRRCEAVKRGWHVVRVRRLSGVGLSTDESSGPTTFDCVTLYLNWPSLVVMRMASPDLSSSRRYEGGPDGVR